MFLGFPSLSASVRMRVLASIWACLHPVNMVSYKPMDRISPSFVEQVVEATIMSG